VFRKCNFFFKLKAFSHFRSCSAKIENALSVEYVENPHELKKDNQLICRLKVIILF
jgi:hypothetical protein